MAATIDDLLAAVAQLNANTQASGGVTAALLTEAVRNTADTVAALRGYRPQPTPTPQPGGPSKPGGAPKPKKKPDEPPGFLRSLWDKTAGRTRVGRAFGGIGKAFRGGFSAKGEDGKVAGGASQTAAVGAVAVGGAVALGNALYEAGKSVRNFAGEQEAVARRLAAISPSQAVNIANLDVNRTFRDLAQGEATAESGKKLTEAIDTFEEKLLPLETALTDLKNNIAGGLMEVLAELIGAIIDAIDEVRGWFGFDALKKRMDDAAGGEPETFGEFLQRVAKEQDAKVRAAQDKIDAARKAMDRARGK